ncbi:glycosyltransferase [Thiorhodococcus minor]|uniref:Glycosyltransferase 2-like domain-containing protein n=1 Tax=Thiorhodococcus minor TaxID=57489 RepID=A0A6M0K954_9GAMM|nr:glycosyltransferase [Thiorhodococcus minor]NEV65005.1 hypothetical protein [Thiorhodococcus minor]
MQSKKPVALVFAEIRKLIDAGKQQAAIVQLEAVKPLLSTELEHNVARGFAQCIARISSQDLTIKTWSKRNGQNHEQFFIIVPVKDGEKEIEGTLKSIFRIRSSCPIFVHVQDGSSTDRTLEIVKDMQSEAAQGSIALTVASAKDRSMYEAIVRGFHSLKPPNESWVTWINAGDHLEERVIENILQAQKANGWQNISWICGCKSVINLEGQLIRYRLPINTKYISAGICDGEHFHHHQQEGTFFRASLFRAVPQEQFASFRLAGDYFLWWTLAKSGKTIFVHDDAFGTFVQSPDQLSRREQETYNNEVAQILAKKERQRAFQSFVGNPTQAVSIKQDGKVLRYLVTLAKKMTARVFTVEDVERIVSQRSIDRAIENRCTWIDPYFLQGDSNSQIVFSIKKKKQPFGIILFTHTRHDALHLVLRSLQEQKATGLTTVWIDGAQGKEQTRLATEETERIAHTYKVAQVKRIKGNYGFRKTMLHGLAHMAQHYDSFLILEDDCFPTRKAVATFREMLKATADDDRVFSVYGHHFRVLGEGELFPRFQGWGWGTTSRKLTPYLHRLVDLYSLLEEDYLKVVKRIATPEVLERIEITPPRQPSHTFFKFFAWDETLALLTGADGLFHAKTPEQTIYNFGMGKSSTHFADRDVFRQPPFNLISIEEAWEKF